MSDEYGKEWEAERRARSRSEAENRKIREAWTAEPFGLSWAIRPENAPDERFDVARIHPLTYHPDGLEAANREAAYRARLIAAAPRMAAALAALLREYREMNAKLCAIGRGHDDPEDGAHPDSAANMAFMVLAEIER